MHSVLNMLMKPLRHKDSKKKLKELELRDFTRFTKRETLRHI